MKNTMKKMLAVVLVLVMCVSAAMPIFAADATANCPGIKGKYEDPTKAEHMKSNCDYEFIATHKPGCGEQGYTVYQCKGCDVFFADDIEPALDGEHQYEGTNATCTTAGDLKCKICGNESTPPATGHDWGKWDNTKPCGAEGAKATRTCKNCGEKETKDLDGDHTWGEHPRIINAPVCNIDLDPSVKASQGLAEYECTVCGTKKELVIYALDHHKDIEYVEIKAAGCMGGGVQLVGNATAKEIDGKYYAQKCKCGWQNYKEVEATHSWGNQPTLVIPVGCNTWGFVYYACTECGTVDARERYEPAGHNMVVISGGNATCGSSVTQERECNWAKYECKDADCVAKGHKAHPTTGKCGHTDTKVLAGLEHDWQPVEEGATCVTPAKTYEKCANCPETRNEKTIGSADPNGHVWVKDLANSTEPTCYSMGMYTYYCTVSGCNGAKQDPVPQLAHDYDRDEDGDVDSNDADYDAPKCGKDGIYTYYCQHDNCANTKVMPGEFFEPSNPAHHDANAREHITENQAGEPVPNRDPSCGISEIRTYKCKTCTEANSVDNGGTGAWITYAVIGAKPEHNLDPTKTVEAKLPTHCLDTGRTEGWVCLDCGAEKVSVALKTTSTKHTLEITSAAKKVTCTEGVISECTATFDIVDEKGTVYNVKPVECSHAVEEKATGHNNTVTGRDNNCVDFGYETYICKVCGVGHVEKYEYDTGHNHVENKGTDGEGYYTEPTCSVDGVKREECTNVHTNRIKNTNTVKCESVVETSVDSLGHLDKDGNVFDCADANGKPILENVECFRKCCCDCADKAACTKESHTIEWYDLHTWKITEIKATCVHVAYKLYVCDVCQYDYTEKGFEFGAHDYTGAYKTDASGKVVLDADKNPIPDVTKPGWYAVKGEEATYTKAGKKTFDCKNDGCKVPLEADYTLTDVNLTVSIRSDVKVGNGYADKLVNSGRMAVTVKANAYHVDLRSIYFELPYSTTYFTFDKTATKIETKLFGDSGFAVGEKNGVIYVEMTNPGNMTNVEVNGTDIALITFFFDIKNTVVEKDSVTDFSMNVTNTSAIKINDSNKNVAVDSTVGKACASKVYVLGNVTGGTIEAFDKPMYADDYDVVALVDLMMKNKYDAVADMNKDGKVDELDFADLGQYIVNAKTYDKALLKDKV